MARLFPRTGWLNDRRVLWLAIGAGFALRAAAAVVVQHYVEGKRPPHRCVFPDTEIYWALAQALWHGQPYEVSLWGVPHYALRTPGYPLFLAACQAVFGSSVLPESGYQLLAVRLVQAALGAGGVWVLFQLVREVWPAGVGKRIGEAGESVALVAALMLAFEPYTVAISVLVLSEALFIPLVLLVLWGMARLWNSTAAARNPRLWLTAVSTGLAAGAAILVRPSWVLCLPALLSAWLILSEPARRGRVVVFTFLICLGVIAVMSPWWLRNASVFGSFVPTALWAGPSLFDGLNPRATGASDMSFLDEPDIRQLNETQLDTTLRERAWAFARAHPAEALRLALVKSARFWSPWPNADVLSSPLIACASAAATIPVYALIIIGLWSRRHDLRAIVLLAGPLVYFWLLHMFFVGSIRYRIPGMVPALGLAAVGATHLLSRGARLPSAEVSKESGQ